MLDMNDEEQQVNSGPVPAGSRVLLRLELQKPKYFFPENPILSQTKSGLLQLFCKFTVLAGSYQGCFWYENITLPAKSQRIHLEGNMQLSARIGGSLIRAIIEAHRRIDPKASDDRSRRSRCIQSWDDMHNMEFPARLGIDKRPYIGQDNREYWNNRIASIVPCTDREFAQLVSGGEIITDGPVTGKSGAGAPRQSGPAHTAANSGNAPAYGGARYGEGGPLPPPESSYENAPYDDVPF